MKAKDLKNLTKLSQKLVKEHLIKHSKTESGFAKEAGIHPAQLLLFMRNERGLTAKSLENIGEIIYKYDKN
jgi:hypothetical protein|tara:strand:- start:8692 stop:8904 length:213 start_codon:yes stop_codon:yes gene_type:complete